MRFQAQFVAQKHADNSRNEFPVAAEAVVKSTSCSFTKSWMRSKPTKECKPINGFQICLMFWKGYQPRLDQERFALPVILLMNSCNSHIFSNYYNLQSVHFETIAVGKIAWGHVIAERRQLHLQSKPAREDFPLIKRNFLMKIVKLFDPLGFVTPFVVRAKILLHDIY